MTEKEYDATEKAVLNKHHVPIRELHTKNNPSTAPKGHVLWEKSKTKVVPAVIRFAETASQFTIHIEPQKIWVGKPYQLLGSPKLDEWRQEDEPTSIFRSEPGIVFEEGTTTAFEVKFDTTSWPWGIKSPQGDQDRISFQLCFSGDSTDDTLPRHFALKPVPIEIYAVHDTLPPYLVQSGIPLQLLQTFCLSKEKAKVRSRQDWITWVTRVCHGSQNPKTAENQSTSDCVIKYNVWNGAPSFTYENGVDFDLDAWVRAKNGGENGLGHSLTNCYDQAGIVQIVFSLGLKYDEITWEFMQPYGYIKETQLVDWGPCNSPMFHGNRNRQIFEEGQGYDRTPFGSHVFLSIGET